MIINSILDTDLYKFTTSYASNFSRMLLGHSCLKTGTKPSTPMISLLYCEKK